MRRAMAVRGGAVLVAELGIWATETSCRGLPVMDVSRSTASAEWFVTGRIRGRSALEGAWKQLLA